MVPYPTTVLPLEKVDSPIAHHPSEDENLVAHQNDSHVDHHHSEDDHTTTHKNDNLVIHHHSKDNSPIVHHHTPPDISTPLTTNLSLYQQLHGKRKI